MKALEAIRRANRSGPPEHSVRLRVACLGAVVVAIQACASMGEVPPHTAGGAIVLVAIGMVFSYLTRSHPPGWVKIVIAAGAIGASVWFLHAVSAHGVDITTVEDPLTVLLVLILVVHSFHVPSQRDLLFSIGASAGLMAVAGAQAINLDFVLYVVAWVCFSLWGLVEMWTSTSGGARMSAARLGSALTGVVAATAAVFLVLPAPTVAAKISLLARAGAGGSIGIPGALAGDSGSPSQLARAGSSSGPTRVGGYLGFAGSLNTALRGTLGKKVVMLVRAQRPSYWVGETFDTWNGQNWSATQTPTRAIREQSPFDLPLPVGATAQGQSDLQTFYLQDATADLIFHAESASQVWFPTSKVFYATDGTIVSPIGMGKGAIYSVDSQVTAATPTDLRDDSSEVTLSAAVETTYLQLPHPYPRVAALAKKVTTGDTTNYARVQALIGWIGAHTRYSTDIPPLPKGADTVDEFLFGNRVGFCEQISTSLTVMLRSLGIPAREAVGYVPGPYNPVTDLYEVRADDAHAWVQVWFPGYGWQNFDPTASVPLASPTPGGTALHDLGTLFTRIPPLPVAWVAVGAVLVVALGRWRRVRPVTWTEKIARSAEHAGRRAGHPRRPNESLAEYATALEISTGSDSWHQLATSVEASVYGGHDPSRETQRRMVSAARRLRHTRRRRRRHAATGSPQNS